MGVVERRRRLRERAIEAARVFAGCVRGLGIGRVSVFVFGSYARGDFNEWSDVDVLVVTDAPLPANPFRRLDMVEKCLAEACCVEPVILTVDEFMGRLGKGDPAVVEAVERGCGAGRARAYSRAVAIGTRPSASDFSRRSGSSVLSRM